MGGARALQPGFAGPGGWGGFRDMRRLQAAEAARTQKHEFAPLGAMITAQNIVAKQIH